jgi:acetylornithine deacetylase/succinyl-diaminopimelate desuccinylase-like protein
MRRFLSSLILLPLSGSVLLAASLPPEPDQRLAHDIYKEIVDIQSGFTTGATTPVAQAVAARLRAAGFPDSDIFLGGAIPRKMNLVARYHGTGKRKPLLLLAHTDVVEAKREDWSPEFDPFKFTEKDGYYYGRGTADDKAQAAVWVETLIRLKREGFKPDRDIILALTADEEGGGPYNGVKWLLANKRQLIDADFALNEGGKGELDHGKPVANEIQVSEKSYINYRFEVHNKGGHSSQPVPDNAIYHLAGALTRLAAFGFPLKTNEVTRAYFTEIAKLQKGTMAADLAAAAQGSEDAMQRVAGGSPAWNSMLRTTCVATMLEGGHAQNALPQLAAANVNCRILPEDSLDYVTSTLKKVVNDEQVGIRTIGEVELAASSPMRQDILKAVNRITDTMWPGVIVVPEMSTGATDGKYLRAAGIPTYGVQGFFVERNDNRSHGRDERMRAQSFYEGQTFLYELVKSLAQ